MNEKSALRKELKLARLSLTKPEFLQKNQAISEKMSRVVDWKAVKTIHFFEPFKELMEIDLNDFISDLQDNNPDKQFFTPKLIENEWRTVALQAGEVPDQFDVIIVPMLGFDASLHRLGYGGGFYDKFLATQTDAQKIGVCFELGKVAQLPIEAHDVPLDKIVTEEKIY